MTFVVFKCLVLHGASRLKYWDGEKRSMDNPRDRLYNDMQYKKPGAERILSIQDEFVMVWIRLRHDIRQEMLADLYKVSVKTVSRTLSTWINFMYDHFKGLIAWPTRKAILANLPSHFLNCGMVRSVIDATEIFIEKPSSFTAQYLTWSDYKAHNTMKVILGVTPDGMVNFITRVWGGRASDRKIFQSDNGNFLPLLEPNDVIMADKGFTVGDLLPVGVGLNLPPFVKADKQMTAQELSDTQTIATPRIVVEMKMEQLKNYRILQGVFNLSEAALAEQIVVLCAAATNLQKPLLV